MLISISLPVHNKGLECLHDPYVGRCRSENVNLESRYIDWISVLINDFIILLTTEANVVDRCLVYSLGPCDHIMAAGTSLLIYVGCYFYTKCLYLVVLTNKCLAR